MYRIVETQDYYPVSVMCHECGLEVEPSQTAPGYVQKMWKCEDTDTGEMVAAAVTAFRDGCHVLENLVRQCGTQEQTSGRETDEDSGT